MKLYLLTSGKLERDFSGEFPNVYQATAFTNLKKAKKKKHLQRKKDKNKNFEKENYWRL